MIRATLRKSGEVLIKVSGHQAIATFLYEPLSDTVRVTEDDIVRITEDGEWRILG